MATLLTDGLIADVALAILALEAVVLWAVSRRRPGLFRGVAPFLVAGAGLLLALKGALAGWPPTAILGGLTLSGVAHALDLWLRLRR